MSALAQHFFTYLVINHTKLADINSELCPLIMRFKGNPYKKFKLVR